MSDKSTYGVYCYGTLDGAEITNVIGFLEDYHSATRLADFSLRSLGCVRAEVMQRMDDGSFVSVYEVNPLLEYIDALESIRQLREAGALDGCDFMPDPEDSPFFATPCAPLEMV